MMDIRSGVPCAGQDPDHTRGKTHSVQGNDRPLSPWDQGSEAPSADGNCILLCHAKQRGIRCYLGAFAGNATLVEAQRGSQFFENRTKRTLDCSGVGKPK